MLAFMLEMEMARVLSFDLHSAAMFSILYFMYIMHYTEMRRNLR